MRMAESDLSAFNAREKSRGNVKPLKLTKPEPTEAAVLSSILRALRIHPAVVWSHRMNSGAGKLQVGKSHSQFIRFGFKGCPDIIGQLKTGHALLIEVKRPSGRVAPEQASFIERARDNGAVAFVARSVADVFAVLDGVAHGQNGAQKETAASSVR